MAKYKTVWVMMDSLRSGNGCQADCASRNFDWEAEEEVAYAPGGDDEDCYEEEYCEKEHDYPAKKCPCIKKEKECAEKCHKEKEKTRFCSPCPWEEEKWICTKECRVCCEKIPCKKDHGKGDSKGFWCSYK